MANPSSPDRTRYLIIGTGRCGSSLLSGVLADAGADFGMPEPVGWKRSAGAFEHPAIQAAGRARRAANHFAAGAEGSWMRRKLRRYHTSRMKAYLRRALSEARFVKAIDLVDMVHPIFKLDYAPRIILSYRRFADVLPSAFLAFGWTADQAVAHYLNTYRTGLAMLHVFGGAVVGYDELTTPSEVAWTEALAETTGLGGSDLLAARNSRLDVTARSSACPPVSAEADALYDLMAEYKGRSVPAGGFVYAEKH